MRVRKPVALLGLATASARIKPHLLFLCLALVIDIARHPLLSILAIVRKGFTAVHTIWSINTTDRSLNMLGEQAILLTMSSRPARVATRRTVIGNPRFLKRIQRSIRARTDDLVVVVVVVVRSIGNVVHPSGGRSSRRRRLNTVHRHIRVRDGSLSEAEKVGHRKRVAQPALQRLQLHVKLSKQALPVQQALTISGLNAVDSLLSEDPSAVNAIQQPRNHLSIGGPRRREVAVPEIDGIDDLVGVPSRRCDLHDSRIHVGTASNAIAHTLNNGEKETLIVLVMHKIGFKRETALELQQQIIDIDSLVLVGARANHRQCFMYSTTEIAIPLVVRFAFEKQGMVDASPSATAREERSPRIRKIIHPLNKCREWNETHPFDNTVKIML